MYNIQLKSRYIEQKTNNKMTARNLNRLFESFGKYEDAAGRDLYEMSKQELSAVVDSAYTLRSRSTMGVLSTLKDYLRWCEKNIGVKTCAESIMYSNEMSDEMRRLTVSTPEELKKYLDFYFKPSDEQTVDCIYRCYYWLAFSGVKEEKTVLVRRTDVDLKNMAVCFDNKSYRIYKEAFADFSAASTLDSFVYAHPNYSKRIVVQRFDRTFLLSGVKAIPTIRAFRVEFSKRKRMAFKEMGELQSLSYYRVWLSGLFYRTYISEAMGKAPCFEDAAAEYIDGKVYKLGSGRNTIDSKKRQIVEDFKRDYERWKIVHME